MEPVIRFADVSKRYRLGVSRVSLPALAAQKWRAMLSRQRGVNQRREELWALRGVSFDLAPGQCLGLIGPNGAGKTTVLKLLSKITNPTSGIVETRGRLSALIELGAGFHPDLTGRENAYLNGAILGLSRRFISAHFDEIVEFSGLAGFIDTPIKRYSSGMTVRLGFAVASCVQPDILLVDEVLAVGDASFQMKCLERIRSLLQQGTAIIFVSHNLYVVQAICQRAIYLAHGGLLADGRPAEVIAEYEQDVHRKRMNEAQAAAIPEMERHGGLQVTRAEVAPGGNHGTSDGLASDQPAAIHIHYTAEADTGPLNVSAFVRRSDGLVCCMMRTSLNGKRFVLRRGEGIITVHLDRLLLSSGTYTVEAFLLNEEDCVNLTPMSAQSAWFTVRGSAISTAADSGVFEPPATWSHTRKPDSSPGGGVLVGEVGAGENN